MSEAKKKKTTIDVTVDIDKFKFLTTTSHGLIGVTVIGTSTLNLSIKLIEWRFY